MNGHPKKGRIFYAIPNLVDEFDKIGREKNINKPKYVQEKAVEYIKVGKGHQLIELPELDP